MQHLFRGLRALDHEQTVVPDVAERFEVSPDGRRYRFGLRNGVVWSDGAPVTADDFASAWRAMREERTPPAIILDDVASATALDAHTLEVRLRHGKSGVLDALASSPSFPWPRHVPSALQEDDARMAAPLVGNGPFVLAASDAEHALLRASATWSGPRGNVREIVLPFIEGLGTFDDEWLKGRGDVLLFASRALTEQSPLETRIETGLALSTAAYVGFRADGGPFADERVRAAFSCAVNRVALHARTTWPFCELATGGLIPPAMPGHSHRLAPDFDPDRARGLLAAAGYPGGRGLPRLALVAPTWEQESTRELVSQLSALGADIEASFERLADIHEAITSRADIWFFGFRPDHPDPDGVLPPLLATNPQLYRDAEINALLEQAQMDPQPRRAAPHSPRGGAIVDRRAQRGVARLLHADTAPPAPVGRGALGRSPHTRGDARPRHRARPPMTGSSQRWHFSHDPTARWTGFAGKTFWDWPQLLVIPAARTSWA